MRIRKRFPPSLSSVPLSSDPQDHRSLLVQPRQLQVHLDGNLRVQQNTTDSQPSDLLINQPPLLPPSDHYQQTMIGPIKTNDNKLNQQEYRWREKEIKSNDTTTTTRKESVLGAEAGSGSSASHPPPLTSSQLVFGGWFEGDKVIPIRKRSRSFGKRVNREEEEVAQKEEQMAVKMKSKMNKKCAPENIDEQEEGKEMRKKNPLEESDNISTSHAKKMNIPNRGSGIMEGSRCSRVNGRGWRCCQETLVGYSLCEHHLGKGRLRSITSVRNRAKIAPKKGEAVIERLSSSPVQEKKLFLLDDDNDDDNDEDDDDEDVTKKGMKLGMVKARSISSLLGQIDNAVVVADNNKRTS